MVTVNLDFLKQKYGYVMTWTEGQASGTDFSRAHKPEIVDRLKRGIEGALKRQRIFGPAMFVWQNQTKQIRQDFLDNKGLKRRGGAGRYLGEDIKFGAPWDVALTDALFDVSLTQWVPGTGEVRTEIKALQFPTLATFVEFADLFIDPVTNTYTHTIYLEAYWLEDSTLPVMQNVFAWNAYFGALSAGVRRLGTVDPEAFNGPGCPPNWLETILQSLWQKVYGVPPVYGTLEELCSCFWMHTRSKGANRYKAAHVIQWDNGGRGVADSAAGWAIRVTVPGERFEGTGLPEYNELDYTAKITGETNSRDWLKQAPGSNPVSHIRFGEIRGNVGGGTSADLKAVGIHPCGIDCIQVPWADPSLYALQVVSEARCNTPQRIREHAVVCNSQNIGRSNILTIQDFCQSNAGHKDDRTPAESRMRWRLKGTPFVGQKSEWKITGLRKQPGKNQPVDGYIVE